MGYRDVLNQLKGMKPLAQKAVKKLSQVAMAPAVKGLASSVLPGMGAATAARKISSARNVNTNTGTRALPKRIPGISPEILKKQSAARKNSFNSMKSAVNSWTPPAAPKLKKRMPR